jgi:Ser-tRNA(Ala) deacylase AlaX
MIKDDVIMHVGTFEPEGSTFAIDSEVEVHVDETKRRLHARIHSAGHLLDIAMRMAGRAELKPSKGFH